jgi:hypothetical protein
MALQERDEGNRIPFTIIEKTTGSICGSSRFVSFLILLKEFRLAGAGWQQHSREPE